MARSEADRRYWESRRHHPDARFLKTSDWQRIRLIQLSAHPLCKHCDLLGIVTPAREVDHVIPPQGDFSLQRDLGNMQSLCKPHHSAKTRHQGKDGPLLLGYNHNTGHPIYA
jgi:5-methylcytosine-specific restriction endonuclease McrA